MKCSYCQKDFSNEGYSFYVEEKLLYSFCNISCYEEFFKKAAKAIKKMSPEELDDFIKKIKE